MKNKKAKMKPPMIVMLGSAKVGKSSLLQRFTENRFQRAYVPTIEDFHTQVMKCPDELYRAFELIDTSGSDEFPVMRELRIKQGDMFIVVYSVDDLYSLKAAVRFCRLVYTTKGEDVALLLVGNKIDLAKRAISSELVLDLTKDLKCPHIEASAKLDVNIRGIINTLLELKNFASKDKKNEREEGSAAGSCRLFRCFSLETKNKRRTFQRSNTFSGITDDGFARASSKI